MIDTKKDYEYKRLLLLKNKALLQYQEQVLSLEHDEGYVREHLRTLLNHTTSLEKELSEYVAEQVYTD